VITRSKGHSPCEEDLPRNLGVALSRLESSKSKSVFRVVADVHVGVWFTRIEPPQSFRSDRWISSQGSIGHLLDVGGSNRVSSAADVGAGAVPGLHQGGSVELETVEANFWILDFIEALLSLEFLLDVGVALDSGDSQVGFDGTKTGITKGFLKGVVLNRSSHVDGSGIEDSSYCSTTSDGAVSGVGVAIPGGGRVVVQRFRETIPVRGVVGVLTIEVQTNGHVSADGHVGVGHTGLNELEGCIGAFVDDLNILFGEGDVDLEELHVELKLLFNLRFSDIEFLTLEVRSTN